MNKELEALALKVANDQTWSIDTFSPVFDQELLIFASRFLAAVQAQQEPVAWSITTDGDHTGNVSLSEYTAGTKMDELNRIYPPNKRALVPLYAIPPAIPEQEPVAHSDHPMRHWDRTCPACNPAPIPEGMVIVKSERLIACRDALVDNDVSEAYHQLYTSVDWADPYNPWLEWEAAAGDDGETDELDNFAWKENSMNKELEALALKVAKREFDRLYGPSENEPDKKAQIFLTEFASRFLDAIRAQQEPVAWCIYISGEPSDVYLHKQTAERECARRDKLYPDPTRQFIPLYAAPKGQK